MKARDNTAPHFRSCAFRLHCRPHPRIFNIILAPNYQDPQTAGLYRSDESETDSVQRAVLIAMRRRPGR